MALVSTSEFDRQTTGGTAHHTRPEQQARPMVGSETLWGPGYSLGSEDASVVFSYEPEIGRSARSAPR